MRCRHVTGGVLMGFQISKFLLLLLNDENKLESSQEDGRTRQEIPQTACCKTRACNCKAGVSKRFCQRAT